MSVLYIACIELESGIAQSVQRLATDRFNPRRGQDFQSPRPIQTPIKWIPDFFHGDKPARA